MRHGEIPEETAKAIWRRAAELQAEAEYRMEERTRALAAGPGASASGLRADDVEAAAVEAGISPEFVHIAIAELSASDPAAPLAGWEEHGARIMLGPLEEINLSRTITGSVDEVSAAILRVFQANPWAMLPRDVIDLPSGAGRVIVFGVARYDWSGMTNQPFVSNAYMISLKRLQATIRPLADGNGRCEVLVTGDLRTRLRGRWRTGAATAAGSGLAGGGLGIAIAGGLSLGALVAIPAALGFAATAGVMTAIWSGTSRYYRKQVEEMLDEALASVGSSMRASAFYNTSAAPLPLPEALPGDPPGASGLPGLPGGGS